MTLIRNCVEAPGIRWQGKNEASRRDVRRRDQSFGGARLLSAKRSPNPANPPLLMETVHLPTQPAKTRFAEAVPTSQSDPQAPASSAVGLRCPQRAEAGWKGIKPQVGIAVVRIELRCLGVPMGVHPVVDGFDAFRAVHLEARGMSAGWQSGRQRKAPKSDQSADKPTV